MSDDTGLLEHARSAIPRRWCGYCVDDVSRGLAVVSRERDPSPEVAKLGECYLAFLSHALAPDGTFHNRFSYDRRWEDEPGNGDWWGRALWGLGYRGGLPSRRLGTPGRPGVLRDRRSLPLDLATGDGLRHAGSRRGPRRPSLAQ